MSAEGLWDIMADLENWPKWNLDVEWVTLDGPVAVGTVFWWKSAPGKIVSTLRRVERPNVLAWTGRSMGIRAVHAWQFERATSGDGATASMEESFDGVPAWLFRKRLQRQLDAATMKGPDALKAAAERRSL